MEANRLKDTSGVPVLVPIVWDAGRRSGHFQVKEPTGFVLEKKRNK